MSDPRLGSVVDGRYRIVEPLARGGMGVVYRGERVGIDRAVAIKFLHESATSDIRRRFEGEARAASRMHHPNVVGAIDLGLDGDAPYVVLEFIHGRNLRELLRSESLSIPRALRIAHQVIAGLAHAHGHGVVHRDVKPENILVRADDHALITDFGLAKRLDALGVTADLAIGTPVYMSPEQTLGLPIDARADVYAMGVVLYELLAERPPFKAKASFETMRMHREEPVPPMPAERTVPAELERVVRRALEKGPDERYASAIELAEALRVAMLEARDRTDDEVALPRTRWTALFAIALYAMFAALVLQLAVR